MNIVYKYVSPSHKSYVGMTSDENSRKLAHRNTNGSAPLFHKAILKYGFENFVYEVIESGLSREDAFAREKYWIKKFGSFGPNGYNLTEGGSGCGYGEDHPSAIAIRWYSKTEGERTCGCMSVLADFLDVGRTSIYWVVSGVTKQAWSRKYNEWIQFKNINDTSPFDPKLQEPKDSISTAITIWDIDKKTIDNTFPSLTAASNYYGLPNKTNIFFVLNGKCQQFIIGNRRFDAQRDTDPPREWNDPPPPTNGISAAIVAFDQDDNDDNYVLWFPSIKEAKLAGYSKAGVCANHDRLHAGKTPEGKQLRWEFEDPIRRARMPKR